MTECSRPRNGSALPRFSSSVSHTLPTVLSRTRGWISPWLSTGVSRRKRSMIERTKGRAWAEVTSTGISPWRRVLEAVAHRLHEVGEARGLHGEVALVALADDRLEEGLLPLRREGDDWQVPGGRGVLGTELAGEARPHVLDDVARVLHAAGDLRDAFDDSAEVADRDALGKKQLQHALDAGRRELRR